MNYNLAKELKDAGFPQEYALSFIFEDDSQSVFESFAPHAKLPTLSELIEACVGGETCFFNLEQHGITVWRCRRLDPKSDTSMTTWATGSTPEEAVASLWLSLHNKG